MKVIIIFLSFLFITNVFSQEYALYDIEAKKIVQKSKNINNPMYLASISKLFTFSKALEHLGPDFRSKTKLMYTGRVSNTVLEGDILLYGGGDPLLSARDLIQFALELKKHGISKVKGNFYYYSIFPTSLNISNLGKDDDSDNPSFSGLNVEFNRFRYTRSNIPIPELKHLNFSIKKTYKYDESYSYLGNFIWQKNSESKHRYLNELPSKNSSVFTANYFYTLARKRGITLNLPEELLVYNAKKWKTLAQKESLKLVHIAQLGLEYSNNVIAEVIQLHLKHKINKSLRELFIKDKIDISIVNGSGLGEGNKGSVLNIVELLTQLSDQSYGKKFFEGLLNLNGHSGTLRNTLLEYPMNIAYKSGSMFFVNNFAGYLYNKNGKKFIFAVFDNDPRRSNLSKKSLSERSKILKGESTWRKNSQLKIEKILKEFIEKSN